MNAPHTPNRFYTAPAVPPAEATQRVGHTPGPWHLSAEFPARVFAYDRHATALAECNYGDIPGYHEGPDETDIANARLIAAAPDLLLALEMLHDNIAEYAAINNLGGFDNHDMRMARAAIEKATRP